MTRSVVTPRLLSALSSSPDGLGGHRQSLVPSQNRGRRSNVSDPRHRRQLEVACAYLPAKSHASRRCPGVSVRRLPLNGLSVRPAKVRWDDSLGVGSSTVHQPADAGHDVLMLPGDPIGLQSCRRIFWCAGIGNGTPLSDFSTISLSNGATTAIGRLGRPMSIVTALHGYGWLPGDSVMDIRSITVIRGTGWRSSTGKHRRRMAVARHFKY